MLTMSKKKPSGRPKGEPTVPIQIKVAAAMAEALQRLAHRNHRSRTLQLVLILEKELRAEGLWPPPSEEEGE